MTQSLFTFAFICALAVVSLTAVLPGNSDVGENQTKHFSVCSLCKEICDVILKATIEAQVNVVCDHQHIFAGECRHFVDKELPKLIGLLKVNNNTELACYGIRVC